MRRILSAVVVISSLVAGAAFAGDTHGTMAPVQKQGAVDNLKMVTVPELAQLLKDKKVTVLDANNTETRSKYGVIPGAVLLTSFKDFDATKDIHAAKESELVFYCANTQCQASHTAAHTAMKAGFTNVAVLSAGIMGWKDAGQPTSSVPRS